MKGKFWIRVIFSSLLSISAAANSDLTLAQIGKILEDPKVTSLEELLERLPITFRSNFTLIKDSMSLQQSTPQYPRALMFTPDARLACTFNGHESLRGYDSLECYQFNDEESKFDFREILFPSPRNSLVAPRISQPNFTVDRSISCVICHRSDPIPNWDGYSRWAGIYGSHDDQFTNESDIFLEKEKRDFLNFKKTYMGSLRYSKLGFDKENIYSPYSEGPGQNRPNLRFSAAIIPLIAKRNARFLLSKEKIIQYKFLSGVGRCGETEVGILEKITTSEAWVPYFRSRLWNCKECNAYNHGDSGFNLSPETFDYGIGGNDRTGSVNSYTAEIVLRSLINGGDTDLSPFYTSAPLSISSLSEGCGVLREKIKRELSKAP